MEIDPIQVIATKILEAATKAGFRIGGMISGKYLDHLRDTDLLNSYLQKLTNQTAYFSNYRYQRQHIRDAYVEPRLADKAVVRMHLDPKQVEIAFGELDRSTVFREHAILDTMPNENRPRTERVARQFAATALVNDRSDFIVLGDAGEGKSSLLAYLCWTRLHLPNPKIPIFLDSNDAKTTTLRELIISRVEEMGLSPTESLVDTAGRMLVIYVDGLDELSDNMYAQVCLEVSKLKAESPELQFNLTCRSGSYKGDFSHMQEYTIRPFNRDQIETFIHRWHDGLSGQPGPDDIIYQIDKDDRLFDLATRALLLAMMCHSHRRYLDLSGRPTAMFSQCFEALLWEWDSKRGIRRKRGFATLDIEQKKWLHSALAAEMHGSGLKHCKPATPLKLLIRELPKYSIDEEKAPQVLKELVSHHNIFVKVTEDTYGFGHLALQEYLTAIWYSKDRRWESLFTPENISNPWWEHVIAYTVASLDDATTALKRLCEMKEIGALERMTIATHCLRYEPVVEAWLREAILNKVLDWYHNGKDRKHRDAAAHMLVGINDEISRKLIHKSLSGNLTAELIEEARRRHFRQ